VEALGAIAAVAFITEVVVRAWRPDRSTLDRLGPVVAVLVATLAVAAGLLLGWLVADIPTAIMDALLLGLGAMGLHDVASAVGKAATNP
jgi:hypothetical protein